MKIQREFIYSGLRVCAKCGSGFWRKPAPIDLFCQKCWAACLRWMNQVGELRQEPPPTLIKKNFELWSLFTWSPLNDDDLRPLLYSLKGGGLQQTFHKLAEHFSFERGLERSKLRGGDAVLVVPPSRTTRDHAWQWANALSQIWQIPIWEGLARADNAGNETSADLRGAGQSQKSKTIGERQRREFVAILPLPKQRQIIFTDDVLTSGSTALASWKALLGPRHFQVWTVASRPKLAGF